MFRVLATTAWRILWYWMEKVRRVAVYCKSSREQPTSGGLPLWELAEKTTTHLK
jgi:hypothetical protein